MPLNNHHRWTRPLHDWLAQFEPETPLTDLLDNAYLQLTHDDYEHLWILIGEDADTVETATEALASEQEREKRARGEGNDPRDHLQALNDLLTSILEQARSIEKIPPDQLPLSSEARHTLLKIAQSGQEVYAYPIGGGTQSGHTDHWCLWIDALARRRTDKNGRVTVEQWRDHWRELLAEAGLTRIELEQPARADEQTDEQTDEQQEQH